jgi:hypothetical protein
MTRLSRPLTPLMLAAVAVGCGDPAARTAPTASQAATTTTTVASASTAAAARSADTHPLDKEFDQAPETEIPGGKEAGCVAKVVVKNVRVICSARDGRPAPDAVVKTSSSKRLDSKVGATAYVETVFEPGLDLTATFVWGERARELTMKWPDGAPKPSSYGSIGAETAFANPCKQNGVEGFGSKGSPCRFKDGAALVAFKYKSEFAPSGASPERQKPLFEVENRSTATVMTLTVSLAYFDGAGKPVEQDSIGEPFRATTVYTADKKLKPKAKAEILLGPERPRIPETVKRIDVTLHEFTTWDPEASFVRERAEQKDGAKK